MFWLATALGADLNVCGGCTYPTVAEAINAAGEGDNVIIAENEVIVETTTANPNAANIHVFVANQGTADVTLVNDPWLVGDEDGLVIEGLNITPTTNDKVLDLDAGSVTFRDTSIYGPHASDDDGGLFHVDGGLLTLDNVSIVGATTSKKGGVLFLHGAAGEAVVMNSNIKGSTAGTEGGGFAAVEQGTLTIDNTAISGATQSLPGSIVYVKNSGSVTIQNGTLFDGGSASWGGHIYVPSTAMLNIYDSTLQAGSATSSGGSIYMAGGTLDVDNVDFYGNSAAADGGAIFMLSGTATIDNSLFDTNTSVVDGSAVYTTNADFTFTNTDFNANDARWGAVYLEDNGVGDLVFTDCDAIDNTAAQGAVAHLDGDGDMTVNGGIWTGNVVTQGGGAIAMHGFGALTLDGTMVSGSSADTGGVIESFYSDVTLIGSSLSATATGAGGCVTLGASVATFVSTDTNYTDCASGTVGGAVHSPSTTTVEIDGGTFSGNSADRGGALFINGASVGFIRGAEFDSNVANAASLKQGGAIWGYLADFDIGRNEFCLNSAGASGGGLYLYLPGLTTDVHNNVFCANAATSTGGGLYATNGPLSIRNNTFLGNDSAQGAAAWLGSTTTLVNNLFAFNFTSNAVHRNSGLITYTNNYFYGNAGNSNDAVTTGQFAPGLSGYDDCVDDSYVHDYDGPLVDAGSGTDPDGSPADIGAYGGPDADPDAFADADSDTWVAMWDCDDELGSGENNYPTNDEECDGVDNDCDGLVDDDDTAVTGQQTWYEDTDGDGFGAGAATGPTCDQPSVGTWVTVAGDCEPGDALINPNTDWYVDADDDGYGNDELASIDDQCTDPSTGPGPDNYTYRAGDCDDTDENVNPETTWFEDKDSDDYGDDNDVGDQQCEAPTDVSHVYVQGDCDDDDPDENPESDWYLDDDGDGYGAGAATEQCERPSDFHVLDNSDCDDADPAQNPATVWFEDKDKDGFGDPGELTIEGCADPSTNQITYVYVAGDCADLDPAIHPDADEICDEIDNNCNDDIDEDDTGIDPQLLTDYYPDVDQDDFGDEDAAAVTACFPPSDHVTDNTDCDDDQTDVYPGAPELCDGIDNDCDGSPETQNQVQYVDWYDDLDGDGFGAGAPQTDCQQPAPGMVTNGSDCDDTVGAGADINPSEDEVCDGVDNDCSGTADDNPTDGTTYYVDDDEDGYGVDGTGVDYCPGSEPAKTAEIVGDCNDADATVNPGQLEVCNGVDDNCNLVDDDNAIDATATYADTDGDGFGDPGVVLYSCSVQSGYVTDNSDCDDEVDTTYPGAPEQCDGVDNDCDSETDEEVVYQDYYPDTDEDGYGDGTATPLNDCTPPDGHVLDTSDCDDSADQVYPGASDTWYDGIDSDCAGDNDYDQDGDGYVAEGYDAEADGLDVGDCDDTDPLVNPGTGDCSEPTSSRDEVDAEAWNDAPASTAAQPSGCDCDSGGRTPLGFAPMLGLLLLLRRRSTRVVE